MSNIPAARERLALAKQTLESQIARIRMAEEIMGLAGVETTYQVARNFLIAIYDILTRVEDALDD